MPDLSSGLWPILAAPLVGSFLGVIVSRHASPRSILLGRSRCDHCHHRLGPRDLIPIVSWIMAGGRCRHCDKPLGPFYPAIEIATLAVAIWAAASTTGWPIWTSCLLGWTLLALAAIDLRAYCLPDFLTLPLLLTGLVVTALFDPARFGEHAIGAALGYLLVLGIRQAYWLIRGREGIGLGDAKLLAASGAWASWEALPSIILVSAALALLFVLCRPRQPAGLRLTDPVAFGAFLCLGTWLVYLYGPIG